jgi:predicted oxidoreductase
VTGRAAPSLIGWPTRIGGRCGGPGHLHSRALGRDGQPIDGLYAAGEVAGFGGGGAHGYNALEGTFLGGCLFSGRTAGRDLTHRL